MSGPVEPEGPPAADAPVPEGQGAPTRYWKVGLAAVLVFVGGTVAAGLRAGADFPGHARSLVPTLPWAPVAAAEAPDGGNPGEPVAQAVAVARQPMGATAANTAAERETERADSAEPATASGPAAASAPAAAAGVAPSGSAPAVVPAPVAPRPAASAAYPPDAGPVLSRDAGPVCPPVAARDIAGALAGALHRLAEARRDPIRIAEAVGQCRNDLSELDKTVAGYRECAWPADTRERARDFAGRADRARTRIARAAVELQTVGRTIPLPAPQGDLDANPFAAADETLGRAGAEVRAVEQAAGEAP